MRPLSAHDHFDRSLGRTAFGADPRAYDEARPGYPDALFRLLRKRCGLARGSRVLEIGPGTGKATRVLLELGAVVVAVEPDPALAGYVRERLPGVDVLDGPFEDVDLADARYDLAVAATSFHWVQPEVGLPKVFSALRPGGWWAMWWNAYGDPARPDPFMAATDHLFERVGQGLSTAHARWEDDVAARSAELEHLGFEQVAHESFSWTAPFRAAEIRALYATYSSVGVLARSERERLLEGVERVAADEFGGSVERPFSTKIYTAWRPQSPLRKGRQP